MLYMTKLTIEQIAKVAHEVNRAYAQAIGETPKPPFEEAPESQRESLRKGVQFTLDNPQSKPNDSHDSWLQEKIRTGWHYGPKIDEIRQEHPDFMPYEQLPEKQKAKDFIFQAIVRQLAAIYIPEPVTEATVQKVEEQMNAAILSEKK